MACPGSDVFYIAAWVCLAMQLVHCFASVVAHHYHCRSHSISASNVLGRMTSEYRGFVIAVAAHLAASLSVFLY